MTRKKRRTHSASGIALAKRCRFAWALRYIDDIRAPELTWAEIAKAEAKGLRITEYGGQRGAALGKEVHARAEVFAVKGHRAVKDWNDLPGLILRELTDLIPHAGSVPKEDVEHEFEVEMCGVVWKGLIDLYRPHIDGIWDHKTTRDILKYALLPHAAAVRLEREYGASEYGWLARSIRNDLQACMYVLYTSVRLALRPGQTVPVRWNYSETGKVRRSLPVIDEIEVLHALKVVQSAAETARECDEYETSDDAPTNTLACGDYGGCWHRGRHCFAMRDYGALLHKLETTGKV